MGTGYAQALKNAPRKSKRSCELITLSLLKSAPGSEVKNALRKSKKSWELRAPSLLKSARQELPDDGEQVGKGEAETLHT